MKEYTTTRNEVELLIGYEFFEEEPAGEYSPSIPEYVKIVSIKIPEQSDFELVDLFNPKVIQDLEEEIYEKIEKE